jgi:hypothetical protein
LALACSVSHFGLSGESVNSRTGAAVNRVLIGVEAAEAEARTPGRLEVAEALSQEHREAAGGGRIWEAAADAHVCPSVVPAAEVDHSREVAGVDHHNPRAAAGRSREVAAASVGPR